MLISGMGPDEVLIVGLVTLYHPLLVLSGSYCSSIPQAVNSGQNSSVIVSVGYVQ